MDGGAEALWRGTVVLERWMDGLSASAKAFDGRTVRPRTFSLVLLRRSQGHSSINVAVAQRTKGHQCTSVYSGAVNLGLLACIAESQPHFFPRASLPTPYGAV